MSALNPKAVTETLLIQGSGPPWEGGGGLASILSKQNGTQVQPPPPPSIGMFPVILAVLNGDSTRGGVL